MGWMLVAVDPGKTTGIAVFHDGEIIDAFKVKDPINTRWVWPRHPPELAVIEIPRIYPRGHPRPQNIVTLALNAGYLAGCFSKHQLVFPRDWKGTRPKDVCRRLSMSLLSDEERRIMTGVKDDNVWDAIGIGLWRLRRR